MLIPEEKHRIRFDLRENHVKETLRDHLLHLGTRVVTICEYQIRDFCETMLLLYVFRLSRILSVGLALFLIQGSGPDNMLSVGLARIQGFGPDGMQVLLLLCSAFKAASVALDLFRIQGSGPD